MRAMFFPCTLDGLPKDSGSARIRCRWVVNYWHGSDVYDGTQRLIGYDLYVFQKAYLTDASRDLIKALAARRINGERFRIAFDLCDPDHLDSAHLSRMMDVIRYFDFAVTPTEPLAKWLCQYLPVYVIPDRVDLCDLPVVQRKACEEGRPALVWAGYAGSVGQLLSMREAIDDSAMSLAVLAPEMPLPFHEFWAKVAQFDILLNPRPEVSPWKFKSDNKTVIAWALGIPVARTPDELQRLLDPDERKRDIVQRAFEVARDWTADLSADEWRTVLENEMNGQEGVK